MAITKKRFAVNVFTNWVATAVGMVVPFFLMPFVVHHLGDVQYGIWILAVSTVSYLGLLDLGLRSAVIRFVSRAQARGEFEDAANSISHALWLRLLISRGCRCAQYRAFDGDSLPVQDSTASSSGSTDHYAHVWSGRGSHADHRRLRCGACGHQPL